MAFLLEFFLEVYIRHFQQNTSLRNCNNHQMWYRYSELILIFNTECLTVMVIVYVLKVTFLTIIFLAIRLLLLNRMPENPSIEQNFLTSVTKSWRFEFTQIFLSNHFGFVKVEHFKWPWFLALLKTCNEPSSYSS